MMNDWADPHANREQRCHGLRTLSALKTVSQQKSMT